MSHVVPFPISDFQGVCENMSRVGVEPGFILYTNHHDSSNEPVARILDSRYQKIAEDYIKNPTDQGFKHLVDAGTLMDTEWERRTTGWQIISFAGWPILHSAFGHMLNKANESVEELTGLDFPSIA